MQSSLGILPFELNTWTLRSILITCKNLVTKIVPNKFTLLRKSIGSKLRKFWIKIRSILDLSIGEFAWAQISPIKELTRSMTQLKSSTKGCSPPSSQLTAAQTWASWLTSKFKCDKAKDNHLEHKSTLSKIPPKETHITKITKMMKKIRLKLFRRWL